MRRREQISSLQQENDRLRRAVEELSVLNDLSREIGLSRDLDDVLGTIVRRSLRAVNAEQGVVTLVDQGAHTSARTLLRTAVDTGARTPMRLQDELTGWMHLHKQPLCINDPRSDSRVDANALPQDLRSLLAVPLLVRARLIGFLTVFNRRGTGGFSPSDQRLLTIIAGQSAQVIEHARLFEEEKKLTEVRKELDVAQEIQARLLPKKPPAIPGYDIHGRSLPASSVGGDFFDYIPLSQSQTALCVGDVSGKGLGAALLMASVQATLRGQTMVGRGGSEVLQLSNKLLYSSMRRGSFVTVFYGVLDGAGHCLGFANAGHNRPLCVGTRGDMRHLDTAGLVLGAVRSTRFQEDVCPLEPGDTLLVYSDGITEAMDERRVQFGEKRLENLLQEARSLGAAEVCDTIISAVQTHAGGAPQSDDLTVLVVRREG